MIVRIFKFNNIFSVNQQTKKKQNIKDSIQVNVQVFLIVVADVVVLHHKDKLLDQYDVDIVYNQWVILYQQL
jgi:hypothetical protein